MFAVLVAVLTEIKVVTVPALEPGAVDGEHLTAVTPGRGEESVELFVKCPYDHLFRLEDHGMVHS